MKKLQAFTLIECIIALFILGISSLLLCQGYSQLMKVTNRTYNVNTSLTRQTKLAEGGEAKNDTNIKRLGGDSGKNAYDFKIKYHDNTFATGRSYASSSGYDCKVSVFAVSGKYISNGSVATYAYDNSSFEATDANGKDGSEMRYVYFLHE